MTVQTRRKFLRASGLFAASTLVSPAAARSAPGPQATTAKDAPPGKLELIANPHRVFKVVPDANREHVEGWMATLGLRSTLGEALELVELVVTYLQGDAERVAITYPPEGLRLENLVPALRTAVAGTARVEFAMRLTSFQPQALGIDRARCEMTVSTPSRGRLRLTREILLETFIQQTRLYFPFKGPGIITQGGALDDGHRNRSGQHAVDAMALSELYAFMARNGDSSDSAAGWGREILAPADGVVAVARSDRPDQPMIGNADPKYFVPEFPDGGDPGNHVVIDHGHGEFSMIAHFQHDTLKPKVGDRVTRGEVLGLLGSSGDTSAPHVHHQLQSGPDWTTADALPHSYENDPKLRHDRGTTFNAK